MHLKYKMQGINPNVFYPIPGGMNEAAELLLV